MGNTYGHQLVLTAGRSIQVQADGQPEMKPIGVTVDWSLVPAQAGSDVTHADGITVKVGEKALRYGQVLTRITASGKYSNYDPAAVDGRQTITPGSIFIVNETVREDELASDHPPVLYGGLVWRSRIIATAGAASLAAGPTYTTLLAALPRLQFITD